LHRQPFFSPFANLLAADISLEYHNALAGFAAWREATNTSEARYAALNYAHSALMALCEREPTIARLSTHARVAWELGERVIARDTLIKLATILKSGKGQMSEPFWPAGPRFDAILSGPAAVSWFVVATLEQLDRLASHSSYFGESGVDIPWLLQQPFTSTEVMRRAVLKLARTGRSTEVPEGLKKGTQDHLNADIWRAGAVPNTKAKR
jgi:hypothetical protein